MTQPQAIKGLGGIGKTQIAVEYAYRSREQGRYAHTFWINAASSETIMASFVTLVELLPGFAAKNETDQSKLASAIKRWLEQCEQRCLLIFDNADDLALGYCQLRVMMSLFFSESGEERCSSSSFSERITRKKSKTASKWGKLTKRKT